ncbi:MAG: MBL fold metallo-hydrolase [Candidatus Ozemobacteraceae bacterium]
MKILRRAGIVKQWLVVVFVLLSFFFHAQVSCFGLQDAPAKVSKSTWMPGWLTVTFVDVGKGDATIVRLPDGRSCLIDTGYAETTEKLFKSIEKRGITAFDLVVVTHFHKDHVGGLPSVLEKMPVKQVIQPFDPREKNRTLRVKVGDVLMSGEGYKLAVVGPRKLFSDENDASLVLRLTFGTTSFLFAGDIVEEAQGDLLKNSSVLRSSVLKVPHHGRYEGFSPRAFFQTVRPNFAIITCDNSNNEPPEGSVVRILEELGAQVMRTDQQGNVGFRTDGKELTLLP